MTLPSVKPSYETSDIFFQPQLTRYHHAFRSPMQSESVNLEINQLRFDILKMYERLNDLQANMVDYLKALVDGSGVDTYEMVFESATPSSNYAVVSLTVITQALEAMSDRLLILEKGL
jgi:hypothetical protein